MLRDQITDEILVDILLENQSCRDYDMEGLSGELITLYCMGQCGIGSSIEDVGEKVGELITSYIHTKLVSDGLLEPVFEESGISYVPTAEGLRLNEMIKNLVENSDVE